MNKYIKSDINNGLTLLRVAIANIVKDILDGEETTLTFEEPLPFPLILEYLKSIGLTCDFYNSGNYVFIEGINQNTVIKVQHDIYFGTTIFSKE